MRYSCYHRLFCALLLVESLYVSTIVLADEPSKGFVPEILKVDTSTTEVTPGKHFEMTYYWRNAGRLPSLNNMLVGVHFRDGDAGFFNPDGGCWFNSYEEGWKGELADLPFQADYFPSLPTTSWKSGMTVVEGPKTVTVPPDVPEGMYDILVALYDRGGRIPFGPINRGMESPIENYTSYKIGTIKISQSAGEPVPTTWDFCHKPIPTQPRVESESIASIKVSRPADAIPVWVREPVNIGDKRLGITLDKRRNYALACIFVDGMAFESGGKFPAITVYNKAGERLELLPDDPGWKVSVKNLSQGLKVTYEYDGFKAVVNYKISQDIINISVTPINEGKYKALSLSGGGNLINLPADKIGAISSGFLLVPCGGGVLIQFPSTTQQVIESAWQSWTYPATFLALGYNGHGLIVRCPQYGAVWSYGADSVREPFSLVGEFAEAFRPSAQYFDMPRPEHHIDLQLVPVSDTNGDGEFNWVDIGVAYRKKFIKRTVDIDTKLRDSILGKIDISLPHTKKPLNYSELIEQIKTIDFAPQTWWLVGAHTPPDHRFEGPSYSAYPDSSHDGPGGYDYFDFKRDAADVGARIGIHELFQDVSEGSPDWGKVPLKIDLYGKPKRTWGGTHNGKYWQSYAKDIKDRRFFHALDEHLKNWDVKAGDTWHWDCFTAMGGQQDYSPVHPTTNGTDIRDGMKVLKYIKNKRVHFTSEGLQEGPAEYCDFGWSAQINMGKPWGRFEKAESVPLTPVLFQGKTYYAFTWHPAYGLLVGGKPVYEKSNLNRDELIGLYFGQDVFWQKIADRTVSNMIKTPNGWKVEYTEGGALTVNLANMTSAMTFVLEIDGKRYTPDNPPANPWGVTARRVSGKYELVYPPGYKGLVH